MKKLSFVLLVAFAIVYFKGNNWSSRALHLSFSKPEVLMKKHPIVLKTCSPPPFITINLPTANITQRFITKANPYSSKICPHCGHKNKPSSSICRMCGRPLDV